MQVWLAPAMEGSKRDVELQPLSTTQVVEFLATRRTDLQFRRLMSMRAEISEMALRVAPSAEINEGRRQNWSLQQARMIALAYLYDHMRDFPAWLRQLSPRQLEDVAGVMVQWQLPAENHGILPMEEIEKREVLRALVLCGGSAPKAAKMLKMGKTTIWRKLTKWGYSVENRTLIEKASALSGKPESPENRNYSLDSLSSTNSGNTNRFRP